jgi:hypothetical protein
LRIRATSVSPIMDAGEGDVEHDHRMHCHGHHDE